MKASEIILASEYKKTLAKLKEKESVIDGITNSIPKSVNIINYIKVIKSIRKELSKNN